MRVCVCTKRGCANTFMRPERSVCVCVWCSTIAISLLHPLRLEEAHFSTGDDESSHPLDAVGLLLKALQKKKKCTLYITNQSYFLSQINRDTPKTCESKHGIFPCATHTTIKAQEIHALLVACVRCGMFFFFSTFLDWSSTTHRHQQVCLCVCVGVRPGEHESKRMTRRTSRRVMACLRWKVKNSKSQRQQTCAQEVKREGSLLFARLCRWSSLISYLLLPFGRAGQVLCGWCESHFVVMLFVLYSTLFSS